jgi:hypothetical protein
MDRTGVFINGTFRRLEPNDIPVIVVAQNEYRLVAPFLEHYRQLGITRFLWLDDSSSDGSREFLATQRDVDVWTSNVGYASARRGRLWREMIVDVYGRNRWYVMVDADEFLIYKNCEAVKLAEVTRTLQSKGVKHLFAPMIDLYPSGKIENAIYQGEGMPWEVAGMFDVEGYRVAPVSRGWHMEGGIRCQLSKSPPLLTKYPVVYWDAKTNLNTSIHFPAPYYRNLSPAMGALLHFKFFSDFRSSFNRIVESGSHFDGGSFYKGILDGLKQTGQTELQGDRSINFEGSLQMHRLGFFSDWQ